MAEQAVIREVTVTLRLKPDMEIEASEKACAFAELVNMSPDEVDEVRMAVIEACINAIEHSRSADGKLQVRIAVLGRKDPETLQITVQDHGVGFDPEKLVEPLIGAKLKAPNKRGWGMTIIEGLMDSVDVRSGAEGTSVVMTKAIQPAGDRTIETREHPK